MKFLVTVRQEDIATQPEHEYRDVILTRAIKRELLPPRNGAYIMSERTWRKKTHPFVGEKFYVTVEEWGRAEI